MDNMIWLSWDNHRRSNELAKKLVVSFLIIGRGCWRIFDPILPSLRTLMLIAFRNYKVIIVQNPSLILTCIVCLLKTLKGFRVIQDLHSYFIIHIDKGVGLRGKIYRALSIYCIKKCDLTIVTNEPLKKVVEKYGGKGFILQDAIPDIAITDKAESNKRKYIVFICTYAADEPYLEVIEAGRKLLNDVDIFITGNPSNANELKNIDIPENVKLTGFLSENDYLTLLRNSDAIIDLTTLEDCLVCGAYEAVALEKPLITSNTHVLRDYFYKGTMYSDNNRDSLTYNIQEALKNHSELNNEMILLKSELINQWSQKFGKLKSIINNQYNSD
jgi:hypothetical protein